MLLCSAILLSTLVSATADGDLILGLSGSLDSGTGGIIDLGQHRINSGQENRHGQKGLSGAVTAQTIMLRL